MSGNGFTKTTVGSFCLVLLLGLFGFGTAEGQRALETATVALPGASRWEAPTIHAFEARELRDRLNQREENLRRHHLEIPLDEGPARMGFAAPPPPPPAQVLDSEGKEGPATIQRRIVNEVQGAASLVAEPTVAARREQMLLTGNWFAAISQDDGASFTFVDPGVAFPSSAQGDFCCDQVAKYSPDRDVFFWLLQYSRSGHGNVYRVAFASPDDFRKRRWMLLDIPSSYLGLGPGTWLDYPDLAISHEHLYVSANIFLGNTFQQSVVLRVSLSELLSGEPVQLEYLMERDSGAQRFARGATDPMWWVSHKDTGTLFVYRWPAGVGSRVRRDEVPVTSWTPFPQDSRIDRSATPDGGDWLGRADERITAAWLTSNHLGAAWSAFRDAAYPQPHVRAAQIDRATLAVASEPHIWNPDFSFSYPAVAVDSKETIGIGIAYGGGGFYPSYAVGLSQGEKISWKLAKVASGNASPSGDLWGDYLSVDTEGEGRFLGVGYVLDGGRDRTHVTVHVVRFAAK